MGDLKISQLRNFKIKIDDRCFIDIGSIADRVGRFFH